MFRAELQIPSRAYLKFPEWEFGRAERTAYIVLSDGAKH